MTTANQPPVRIAIIGSGAVSDYHHVPGIRTDPRAALVAACDSSEPLLAQRRMDWSIDNTTTDYRRICEDPNVDAVIIATPNFTHRAIALAAAENGKHVMCEKPLGLSASEVRDMYRAAQQAGIVHMTAFHLSLCSSDALPQAPVGVGHTRNSQAFSQPAVSGLARDELGLAAVPRQGGGG